MAILMEQSTLLRDIKFLMELSTLLWDMKFTLYKTFNKRLLHDVFHIGPGISLRLPYQA